jgi:DNA-binding response OmpR family regulator
VDGQRLILVVEDDEATHGFLAENLAADGFRVAGAASTGERCGRSRFASRHSFCSI